MCNVNETNSNTGLVGQMRPYTANRAHKDTVFRDLFGTEENKANTLSLYNALSGKNYDDPDLLELTTLDNVLYMSVKNDISFLIDDEMILWEHQSTHNPNMPLRGLTYFAHLYTAWVERQDRSVYGHTRISLPTPRYFVFFVGEENRPDKETMRLSDAFTSGPGDVEVTITVLNVSAGHNPGLMGACQTLADYASLVKLIRRYNKSMELRDAVSKAMDDCIEQGVLADYLRDKRAKVREMFLTEYDEATTMRRLREEAIREGYDEGYDKGRSAGYGDGYDSGYDMGRSAGYDMGRDDGYNSGKNEVRQSILACIREKVLNGSMTIQDACDLGFSEQDVTSQGCAGA